MAKPWPTWQQQQQAGAHARADTCHLQKNCRLTWWSWKGQVIKAGGFRSKTDNLANSSLVFYFWNTSYILSMLLQLTVMYSAHVYSSCLQVRVGLFRWEQFHLNLSGTIKTHENDSRLPLKQTAKWLIMKEIITAGSDSKTQCFKGLSAVWTVAHIQPFVHGFLDFLDRENVYLKLQLAIFIINS